MADYEDVWAGTWASTNEEDTHAIDEALQIQGVGWVIRKAATLARPQPILKSYVKDGTMYLELTRTFMGMSSSSTWPVDEIEFERDEPVMGKIRLTVAKKEGKPNVLVITTRPAVDNPTWSATAEWSIETENGQRVHHRKSTVRGVDGKEVNIVIKYKLAA